MICFRSIFFSCGTVLSHDTDWRARPVDILGDKTTYRQLIYQWKVSYTRPSGHELPGGSDAGPRVTITDFVDLSLARINICNTGVSVPITATGNTVYRRQVRLSPPTNTLPAWSANGFITPDVHTRFFCQSIHRKIQDSWCTDQFFGWNLQLYHGTKTQEL